MDRSQRIVIVGGNAAGMTAAMRARRLRPDWEIKVIEKTDRISIANCSIPSYLCGAIEDINSLQLLTPEIAHSHHQIDVLTNHQAMAIQPIERSITIENLRTSQNFQIEYDRLILSTGAHPIRPNWPNVRAEGVFTLRNLGDAVALRNYIERRKPEKFVIIGTGTIAQVCASALRSRGIKVIMIGIEQRLMEELEDSIAERINTTLDINDIGVHISDNRLSIKVSLDGIVEGLEHESGVISCQGILLAMGVTPNTDLAKTAGISCGNSGAFRIDRNLMTSRSGVFACGDCAETYNRITNKPIYWPLATIASRQGRQAGESAVNGNGVDPGTVMAKLWNCFDIQVGKVGLSSNQAKEAGFKVNTIEIKADSKPRIYGGDKMDLVLLCSKEDGRILGAQMAGQEGIHARLNTLSTAIDAKMSVKDLENLDLGYSPEISSLWDPVQIAGRLGSKML